jgi:hypothetical protein
VSSVLTSAFLLLVPFSTASVSACWSILITLFPSFLSLSLSHGEPMAKFVF